jgi:hypothetical protein
MYDDDPNMPRRPMARVETEYTSWVLGALAVLLIAGGVMLAINNSGDTQTASNTGRPAATQPALPSANPPSTTGSGTTSPAPANR